MSDIEIKKWKSKLLEIELWSIKVRGEFYFFGKEVAEALEYKRPKDAIRDHVTDPEDKKTIEEVLGANYRSILERIKSSGDEIPPPDFFRKIQRRQNLLTELGIYSFCTESRMPKAKPFQRWVFKAIGTIRKTGFYILPSGPVDNPLDLVEKVSTSSFQKEIQTLKNSKKIETCDKGTQTKKKEEISLEKLTNRLKSSILRTRKIEFELEKSLKEISSFHFSSSSSSPRHYSSDSD